MASKLYYNTVTPLLKSTLEQLMREKLMKDFRLVGGTALSLLRNHRMSVDIDLFSDLPYGEIEFDSIESMLQKKFTYVDSLGLDIVGSGKGFTVGDHAEKSVKVDIYYTDSFIDPTLTIDGIRMATLKEIAAMKMDVINRGGRKKDFWDLSELLSVFTINEMIGFHKERYPYDEETDWKMSLCNYNRADENPDPECLRGKIWELIKLDMKELAASL